MHVLTIDRRKPEVQILIPGGRRQTDQQVTPAIAIQLLYSMLVH